MENNVNENIDLMNEIESEINYDDLTLEKAIEIIKDLLERNEEIKNIAFEINKASNEIAKDLEAAQNEAASNKDSWYRAAAELENFKKRNADTRKNAYLDGKKDAISNLLLIGDSIDRALTLGLDEKTKEGILLISRQFYDTLTSMGVTVIDPIGEVFDPQTSEAIATVPCQGEEEADTVKTVFKKGYKLDNLIIRYCQVVVCK